MADNNENHHEMEEPTEKTPFSQPEEPPVEIHKPPSFMLFERSAGSLVNPRFDSCVLENYYHECAIRQTTLRFRFALLYVAFCAVVWSVYFIAQAFSSYPLYAAGGGAVVLISGLLFFLTFTGVFSKFQVCLAASYAALLAVLLLLTFVNGTPEGSPIVTFGACVQICLLCYTIVPVRLYIILLIGICLSGLYEVLLGMLFQFQSPKLIVAQILMHAGLHIIGINLHLMSQVRRRSTFLRLCQSARLKKMVELEKEKKMEKITSLMPESVANAVMADGGGAGDDSDADGGEHDDGPKKSSIPKNPDEQVTFRKFHVNQMTDVSILFADIVGFTNMSSNKTAQKLVYLLNDLFGRFDTICDETGCEKIATLGDCYYSVSGCPEPKPDGAQCCVEMGMAMCIAIQEFDEEHNESVNMRVGVHTGMVICGIVGTKRFKFDVWSNDVNIANEMESTGEAGRVHISDSTLAFVKDLYEVVPAESIPDCRKYKVLVEYYDEKQKGYAIKHTQDDAKIATYFVTKRKPGVTVPYITALRNQQDGAEPPPAAEQNDAVAANDVQAEEGGTAADHEKAEGRSDSDLMLVEDMRNNTKSGHEYYKPPVSVLTLNFKGSTREASYRRYGLVDGKGCGPPLSLVSPRITPLVDVVVLLIMLLLTSVACFLSFDLGPQLWLVLVLAVILILVVLLPLVVDRLCDETSRGHGFQNLFRFLFAWLPRNLTGAVIITLPSILVLSNIDPCSIGLAQLLLPAAPVQVSNTTLVTVIAAKRYGLLLGQLLVFSMATFALFTMYSSWTKSVMATLVTLLAVAVGCCSSRMNPDCFEGLDFNFTTLQSQNVSRVAFSPWAYGLERLCYEMLITMLLTLLLIYFLNREFDISYRLSYNCGEKTAEEQQAMEKEKKQATWLLHNIIPSYIEDELYAKKSYSASLTDVAVVFATISNFSDFYDEQFEGGKEMLRVLNEYFADIEELLQEPKYKDVEKIKTTGACFMCACGLNMETRGQNPGPDDHLYAMMDFCIDLLKKTEEFNDAIFSFNFEVKVGYNIGPVVAGVIGTTKLLYDIWGDTVNVSSRMYSTGMKYRVQVTEDVANRLGSKFKFSYRGKTFCKGKGDLNTYLLEGKIDD